ncbi:MAG TPA: hypothetical protein VLT33_28645 [Labilithrix sp.]|nr:hypothetical protein [Labilithrix sp.]
MRRFVSLLATVSLVACSGAEEDADVGATNDELQSSPLSDAEMKRIKAPAGMPVPWDQPDSTGTFDERGKCGPTAVANTLKLYGINVSPAQADRDGVHWLIGTRGINIEAYLQEKHPRLGCTLEHPEDGPGFLRSHVDAGHPVMVWFNMTGGFLGSHWVTVVGRRGTGAAEVAIVMSWGGYYTIPMGHLDTAWENVYRIRRPSIVCRAQTKLIAH